MACPTIADFKLRFPEFSAVPDERIQLALDDTCGFLSEDAFGGCWSRAAAYYAAHTLQLALRATAAVEGGGDAPTQSGSVVSSGADGLSISFASFTPDSETTAWLNTTAYGKQFLIIANGCINSAAVGIFPTFYYAY